MSIEGILVGLLAIVIGARLGLLRAQAVHDPAAHLGVLLRSRHRRPVGAGRLRPEASSRRSCRGASVSSSGWSSRPSRTSGTTPRSSSSPARSATRSGSASSSSFGFGTGFIAIVVGLILGALFAIGTFLLGVPVLLVMVFSAFSGAAAVVNGVLILFGQIKLESIDSGIFGSLLHQGVVGHGGHSSSSAPRLCSTRSATSARRSPRSTGAPTATSRLVQPRSLVAAIDQGTTSSRCILFDRAGQPVASHQLEHAQITPRPGWVEHDADEILERVRTCIRVALREAGADARALAAVGISDQRETTVVWSRRTGRPVHNAIVWQDTRTAGGLRAPGRRRSGADRFRGADRAADLDLFLGAQAGLDPRGRRSRNGAPPPRRATCSSGRSIRG